MPYLLCFLDWECHGHLGHRQGGGGVVTQPFQPGNITHPWLQVAALPSASEAGAGL